MELIYFNWKTNPDYFDLLNRPIVIENINNYRKNNLAKRLKARHKRNRKRKLSK